MNSSRKLKGEPQVKTDIKKFLKGIGAWVFMPVQTGMGEGGIHDFIACVPVTITAEMIGKTVGMFVSVEAKEEGMIEKLRELAAKGKTANSHPSDDNKFISNRALQTYQYEEITKASGFSVVCDDVGQLMLDVTHWLARLGHGA